MSVSNPPKEAQKSGGADSLREKILDLKKPDKFLSVWPIEAELQDLVDLFRTEIDRLVGENQELSKEEPDYQYWRGVNANKNDIRRKAKEL